MIARAALALFLAGPALAAGLGVGSRPAEATTLARKMGNGAGPREKAAHLTHRRSRAGMVAQRTQHRDRPAAFVGSLDDGLAYDTPRETRAGGTSWQVGTASWYGGKEWQGHRMTDGSRYDQDRLTAAHASLPLGSRVRVTLVGSERSVIVQVTDRPGTRTRIIDLSRGAAAELGILSRGVATVALDPL